MTFVLHQPARPIVWAGVIVATAGVWLMTGASPSGFGIGEILGVACAVIYAGHIVLLNLLVTPDGTSRQTAGQFMVVGVVSALGVLLIPEGCGALAHAGSLLALPEVGPNVVLLALFPTVAAFGLQFRFQLRVDPSRAALIYLMEPIFASLFAWLIAGRGLTPVAMMGAAMIIEANLMVELIGAHRDGQAITQVQSPIID